MGVRGGWFIARLGIGDGVGVNAKKGVPDPVGGQGECEPRIEQITSPEPKAHKVS